MTRYVRCVGLLCVVFGAASTGSFVGGCSHPQQKSVPVSPQTPVIISPPVASAHNSVANDKATIKNALVTLLEEDARTAHVFPSGVRVKSIRIVDGVATLDFSHEFSELANSGETVESDAQHSLRATLAKFSSVEKVRVTVDGKPFESQATDWYTPFPVREAESSSRKTPSDGEDSAAR